MIEQIFGSRLRGKILGWLFSNTDERYFVRQLAKILQENSTNISRELARLENMGILLSYYEGKQKYYQINKKCPFYEELKGLAQKTVGAIKFISEMLRSTPKIKVAFIYGSFAKGTELSDSDIDLFLVGNFSLKTIDKVLSNLESMLGREINYVAFTEKEFREKLVEKDGFVEDVIKSKIIPIIGDVDEIRKV